MSVEDPQPTFAVRSVVERGIEKDKFNQLGQGGGVCVWLVRAQYIIRTTPTSGWHAWCIYVHPTLKNTTKPKATSTLHARYTHAASTLTLEEHDQAQSNQAERDLIDWQSRLFNLLNDKSKD